MTVDAKAVRRKLGLTQDEFSWRYGIPYRTLQNWEQRANSPDQAAQVLLFLISRMPVDVATHIEEGFIR